MFRSIAPLWQTLKHLPTPHLFAVKGSPPTTPGEPSTGQRVAERLAAGVGSWPFLISQSVFLLAWLVFNTIELTHHFDPPPYILLNLLLSFQAAFTGPVLLIAANVGALRDHAQADRIESLARQNEALTEQNTQLAQQLLGVEQMLNLTLRQHSEQLTDLQSLMTAVHARVTPGTSPH